VSAAVVNGAAANAAVNALLQAEARLLALGPRPFPLPLGPLAPVVAGAFSGMGRGDWVVASPRERVGATVRGCPVERLVEPTAGARPYKLAPVSGAPGARALHAVGLALGSGKPVLCFLGLASAATGATWEALNAAVLTGAPVVFLHVAPELRDDAPVGPQLAADLGATAAAFGIPVVSPADATAPAVEAGVAEARAAAADRSGPVLVTLTLS